MGRRENFGVPDAKLALNRSGVWELRWTEHDPASGRAKSRTQSCRTTDRAIAEQARRAWLVAGLQVRASVSGAGLVTVGEVAEAYLRHKRFRERSSQAWALRQIVADLGGRVVRDLGPEVLAGYRDRREKTVAGATIRRELGALKAALSWGRGAGLVPVDVQPKVDMPSEGAPKTRYLSEREEGLLWDAAFARAMDAGLPFRERRGGIFVCLALETAAREGAIRGLTWDRVDTARWVIDFRDPQLAVSRKRRVPVPVSDRLRPVLERLVAERIMGVGGPGAQTKYVLGHPGAVRKGFETLRAGLVASGLVERFTVHDLRRTWASLRMQWGVPIEEVAGVLGDTIEVVARHYAHFSPGYLRSAVNMRRPVSP